ncbi:MAG: hypothetical protein FJX84_03985 [Bacteroidetes bacterium]|nr:hypothetical protein [Bacteroidota bacterium]
MKIRSVFFILIQLSLLFILSYGSVNIISIAQIKKEYPTLDFIPDSANLVSRIDTKKISLEIFKEFILQDTYPKNINVKKENQVLNLSDIDFNYPCYFFTLKVDENFISVATFQLFDQDKIIPNTKVKNQKSFYFTHAGKIFWIFNCPEKNINSTRQAIIGAKSTRWEKLRNSKNEIIFLTKFSGLEGYVNIKSNSLKIVATLNSFILNTEKHKKLKTDGLNFTIAYPLKFVKYLGLNELNYPSSSLDQIKSISINHKGYRAPFFPNLTALVHVDSSFKFDETLQKFDTSLVEFENNKLFIGGAKFYVSKPENDCYLFRYNENQANRIEYSDNIIESNGDLINLVNFEDAPLMKMLLLSSSPISRISSIIQKTDNYNFRMNKINSLNRHEIFFSLDLKKPNSFYKEILSFFI